MPLDGCIGIVLLQCSEEDEEGSFLGWGTCIGRIAFLVQSTFVTDSDGVCVVALGMHADVVFVTCLEHGAVLFDVVVIADAFAMEAGIMAVT